MRGILFILASVTLFRPRILIIKTFDRRCAAVTITLDKSRADYVILMDREGPKGRLSRDNKIAVFNKVTRSDVRRTARRIRRG